MAYRDDLDPDTTNRLLSGRLDPDDAPPRHREGRGPPAGRPHRGEDERGLGRRTHRRHGRRHRRAGSRSFTEEARADTDRHDQGRRGRRCRVERDRSGRGDRPPARRRARRIRSRRATHRDQPAELGERQGTRADSARRPERRSTRPSPRCLRSCRRRRTSTRTRTVGTPPRRTDRRPTRPAATKRLRPLTRLTGPWSPKSR